MAELPQLLDKPGKLRTQLSRGGLAEGGRAGAALLVGLRR